MANRRSKTTASKFERLRQAREKGETLFKDYQVQEEAPIYDQVTEDVYNNIRKRAALEDDFIVDDDGQYVGLEDWDEQSDHSTSSTEHHRKRPKKKNVKPAAITALFTEQKRKQAQLQERLKKEAEAQAPTTTETELLSGIFNDLDQDASQQELKIKNKVAVKKSAKPLFQYSDPIVKKESDNVFDCDMDLDTSMNHFDNFEPNDEPSNDPTADIKAEPNESNNEPIKVEKKVPELVVKAVQSSKTLKDVSKFLPKFKKLEQEQATIISTAPSDNKKWKDLKDKVELKDQPLPSQPTTNVNLAKTNIFDMSLQPQGHMYMFWLDAFENRGILYLFGKTFQESTKSFVSCCLSIQGIDRNLFVLPRVTKLNDDGLETDYQVEMGDVYNEFDALRRKYGIKEFASKVVSRKYAFELANIPAESDYLKVVYPFTDEVIPESTGKTFSRIFGTKTSALELFLLKRGIMGPCWLRIDNPSLSPKTISWSKLEIVVTSPKHVSNATLDADPNCPKSPPPAVVMSLNLRTVMNSTKNVNEIVAASALVYTNVNMDSESSGLVGSRFTLVRQTDVPWPMGFQDLAKKQQSKVDLLPNERALLSLLMANILRYDPDVIVGHNFIDFDLDVLLQRMKSNKIPNWSGLGRLRRTTWPKLQVGAGGTGDSSYSERLIVSGRLVCDTFRAAKDLLNSKSNSLTYLSSSQLKIDRPDIEYEKIAGYFWDTHKLVEMIQHMEFDAYLVGQLMFKLQVLPLTKQLTNLAGNLWSRTLMGARAERNEYLLLHEFHDKKYICPDREFKAANQLLNDSEDQPVVKGRRKAAYSGGLVLEPKKGLYDKYVLLLDFNSLYPSIIQEYNICFTTVERTYDDEGDHMPEIPDSSSQKGILPKLLGTLVERRRTVKSLMKDPKVTPQQYQQYDIRQKALKLTANSMYGCLGFVHSRFYAKPIAMLITSKGREILQNTVGLAEQMNLEVVYGDTDSIMIHTHSTDLVQVKKIGVDLKNQVNKRYKLLEIEMDGFFKRLLLLKKKKYAAIVVEEGSNGEIKSHLETKGLDIVRRDWCDLSHDVSGFVLRNLLSSESREDAIENIHQYLVKVGEEVRAGLIPSEKFVINKGLTKRPEEYADKNTQPHVQVALRMKKQQGQGAKVGDTIPYVICKGQDSLIANRAYHIDEVNKQDSELEIDLEWYLANQVHPPVSRLCAPIEGTDNSRLAHCLGLDGSKYHQTSGPTSLLEEQVYSLESQLTDAERFKDVEKFTLTCCYCQHSSQVSKIVRVQNDDIESTFICENSECKRIIPVYSLESQLLQAIREQLGKYLEQSYICDDATCQTRTKVVGVFGRKCLAPKCQGLLTTQVPDRSLYLQMQYFERIFQYDHLPSLYPQHKDLINQIANDFAQHIDVSRYIVSNYLDTSSRHWVDLGKIFSF